MLRVRVTRYQCVVTAAILLAALIVWRTQGVLRGVLLTALCGGAGLVVGLGVSFPQWQMFGKSLCRVQTTRRAVSLTFDDGPDPVSTPPLLDLLARRGVKAVFFCVGERVTGNPELARRIADAGHLVENHSQRHSHGTNLFAVARLRADVLGAQEAIRAVTGRAPVFFRPPMGLTNPRVFRVARELHLRVTGYTARGLDSRPEKMPGEIVARLLRGLRPGAILLLHDGGMPAGRLLETVSLLLDRLGAAGYECVRLDELLECEERNEQTPELLSKM